MARIEIAEPVIPIACTLDASQLNDRLAEWRSVLDRVTERSDIQSGVHVRFAGVSAAELADLAEREQHCCSFFEFTVIVDRQGVALEVRAPADARSILDEIFG